MKVLGTHKDGLIVDIDHTELERIFNVYYNKKIPGIDKEARKLQAGDTINGALIHNYAAEMSSVFNGMIKAVEKFEASRKILADFACSMLDKTSEADNERSLD